MESRYDVGTKIGLGVKRKHALIPFDLHVDLKIRLHNSYIVNKRK